MTEGAMVNGYKKLEDTGWDVRHVESKMGDYWLVAVDLAGRGWLIRHPEDVDTLIRDGRL